MGSSAGEIKARSSRLDRLTAGFGGAIGSVFKYQLITVPVMALLVAGFVAAGEWLAGPQGAITNATLTSFILSWRGLLYAVLLLALVAAGFVLELSGFVTISARALHGRGEGSYTGLVRASAGKLRNFLSWGTLLVVLNLLLVPIVLDEAGDLSFLQGFKIPNFIMSVVDASTSLSWVYAAVSILLGLLSVSLIYTMQFIVIGDQTSGRAVISSFKLFWKHPLAIMGVLARGLLILLPLLLVVVLWVFGIAVVLFEVGTGNALVRIGLVVALLVQYLAVSLFAMFSVPVATHLVTNAFYATVAREPEFQALAVVVPEVETKAKPSLLDRLLGRRKTLIALVVAFVLLVAVPVGAYFSEAFQTPDGIKVVAHRAGGTTAPENSLSGLHNSIELGVDYVEVDVQRTADGGYVLNHDDTFKRAAGLDEPSTALTLAEATALDISANRDGTEHVPSLKSSSSPLATKSR